MTTATDVRTICMSAERVQFLDELIHDLIRAGDDERATTLMAIALEYRFARNSEEPDELAELYVIHGGHDDAS